MASPATLEFHHFNLKNKTSNQKIKPQEEWKDTGVYCQYQAGILSYLEDSSFRIILKQTECFSLTYLFAFLR